MKRVEWSRRAGLKILGIWDWNVEQCGEPWTDHYVDDLRLWVDALADDPSPGRSVAADPRLRYTVFRKKGKGFGHVLITKFDLDTIRITDIFPTVQDWRTDLEGP